MQNMYQESKNNVRYPDYQNTSEMLLDLIERISKSNPDEVYMRNGSRVCAYGYYLPFFGDLRKHVPKSVFVDYGKVEEQPESEAEKQLRKLSSAEIAAKKAPKIVLTESGLKKLMLS